MPKKKALKKKAVISSRELKKLERGRIFEKPLLLIVVALVLLSGLAVLFKPWKYVALPFVSSPISVKKPTMDMSRARQMTISPDKDTVMQIVTREKVRITLQVPKGALKEKTLVKLIPFYYDRKSAAPSAGAIIGPASIEFTEPVTLSFNFSDSEFKNQAPKTAIEQKLRMTGISQVTQIDSKATSLTPTLIAREIETENFLPARVLTGGAYVFSLDGKHQVDVARLALNKDGMHSLTVMESANVLLFNNKKLSTDELKKTKAAVAKILSKKNPPAFELFAALVLQKKITNPSFTLVHKAYAYETGEGFYQAVCRDDGSTVEQYLGFAKAAQLMGYDNIGESCINKAKNKVAEDAKKVLGSGEPSIKAIMLALQNVQLLGVDSETNLDEQLEEKAKEVVTKEAQKVANDPTSSLVDAAVAMQKMEAVGADQGSTYESLKERVSGKVEQIENDVNNANDQHSRDMDQKEAAWEEAAKQVEKEEKRLEEEVKANDIDEEEILANAAMAQLGIAFLKLGGFDQLDKDSLKKKFDEMQAQSKEVAQLGYEACLEAQSEGFEVDCSGMKSQTDELLQQAEELSYRAENEIGNMQSQEYETPEYRENNGEYELYFEEDLTPTPEGGENGDEIQVENDSNNEDTYEESSNEEMHEDSGSEVDNTQNDELETTESK